LIPFEKELIAAEKTAFYSKYGIESGNYMRLVAIEQALKNNAAQFTVELTVK
jgi:hypothetical protein